MVTKKIAILVSGTGTNTINLIQYFNKKQVAKVRLVISNKNNSPALLKAKDLGVETIVFNNESFKKSGVVLNYLKSKGIDFIVLAGFLIKLPSDIIGEYYKRIVNLHPSLLPKFGGKGMYGMFVHQAVIDSQETESGISIHYVNEEYDKGDVIFQSKLKVKTGDTAEVLSKKIQKLEHRYLPEVVERVVNGLL